MSYDSNLPDNLKRDSSFNNEHEVICKHCNGDGYNIYWKSTGLGVIDLNSIKEKCVECNGKGTIIK